MPAAVRIQLVRAMADIEHRLAYGTSDRLQLGALCGAFAGAWRRGALGMCSWVSCAKACWAHWVPICCFMLLALPALSLQRRKRAL